MIIGVTGGIGSGKSTVTDFFSSLGIDIIDSDIIARQVVRPNSTGLKKIQEYFGDSVINNKGELNRPKLRELIFSNPDQKKWLEALLHPMIRDETIKQLNSAQSPYSLYVSPLLIETQSFDLINRLLVIDVTEEQQIARASKRDNSSQEQIKNIITAQTSRKRRIELADDIIDNSGTIEETLKQTQNLHKKYLALLDKQK